jgi:hypothetical protein
MKIDTNKLQILTAVAILVLVSGGIATYAQVQSTSSSTSSTIGSASASSSSSTSTQTSTSTSTSTVTSTVTATNTTTTTSTPAPLCANPAAAGQPGRLILPISPSQSQAQSGTIVFTKDGGCVASITTVGGIFYVDIQLRHAKPVTQYSIVLVANGTGRTLGNLVTGPDGAGQIRDQLLLTTGTFAVSIQIFDTSSAPGQSTMVMQSSTGTIVSPPFPTTTSHDNKSSQGSDEQQGNQGSDHNKGS